MIGQIAPWIRTRFIYQVACRRESNGSVTLMELTQIKT